MHHGFRIIDDMIEGMTNWMESKGITSLDQIRGKSLPRVNDFGNFDLLNRTIARIDQQKCIHCNLCYIACEDAAHQCIDLTRLTDITNRSPGKRLCRLRIVFISLSG